MTAFTLQLTVAHHDDEEFYGLGEIVHEVPAETLLASLPTDLPHVCDDANMCFIVDMHEGERGIVDDREVSRELAETLLGASIDQRLAEARRALADVYEFEVRSPDRAAELRAKAGAA